MVSIIWLFAFVQLLAFPGLYAKMVDDDVIKRILDEANAEIEEKLLLANAETGFNSIPGHASFINSKG